MSLAPAATIILGNLKYDSHAADVEVTLSLLPGVNRFRAALPSGAKVTAAPGDDASLELDGGEGSAAVMKGKIRTLRKSLLATEALVTDAGAELAAFRPKATYEKQSAKDVINAVAGDRKVKTATVDIELPLAAFVAHQGRTGAEHIANLATFGGAIATVDANGALNVIPRPGPQPELALLYGREIVDYQVSSQAAPQVRRIAIGSGPAGSPDAPDALRPSASALPGDAPKPGGDAIWFPSPLLRTPKAASTASSAADAQAAAAATRVRARCFLLPKLRPGVVIEVQSLPDGLKGGPWMITQVTHRLKPGLGGMTTFEGELAGASGGAMSLLDAAIAAVGSLL